MTYVRRHIPFIINISVEQRGCDSVGIKSRLPRTFKACLSKQIAIVPGADTDYSIFLIYRQAKASLFGLKSLGNQLDFFNPEILRIKMYRLLLSNRFYQCAGTATTKWCNYLKSWSRSLLRMRKHSAIHSRMSREVSGFYNCSSYITFMLARHATSILRLSSHHMTSD